MTSDNKTTCKSSILSYFIPDMYLLAIRHITQAAIITFKYQLIHICLTILETRGARKMYKMFNRKFVINHR